LDPIKRPGTKNGDHTLFRKAASLFSLTAYALFSMACVTWKTADPRTAAQPPSPRNAIRSLVTTSGEMIRFDDTLAHVRDGRVTGRATNVTPAEVSIPLSEVKQIYYRESNGTLTTLLVAGLLGVTVLFGVLMKNANFIDVGPIFNRAHRR